MTAMVGPFGPSFVFIWRENFLCRKKFWRKKIHQKIFLTEKKILKIKKLPEIFIQQKYFSAKICILAEFFSRLKDTKLGPKGPTIAAKGCSPPQELEKNGPWAAIFLFYANYSI